MISLTRHPEFWDVAEMLKWRLAYSGGRQFIDQYLISYSSREDATDFAKRKCMTYVPRFARSGLDEVKDAIYQRMPEIVRANGPASYLKAITGVDGGVDKDGRNMDSFIGQECLLELLLMGRVGIFVDMPAVVGTTLADTGGARPYLYKYTREQIENWVPESDCPGVLKQVRLVDEGYEYDEEGFPKELTDRHRLIKRTSQGVTVTLVDSKGEVIGDTKTLELDRIPFVCLDINESLMADLADYQVALMNLTSADMSFLINANHTFYTEQADPRSGSAYVRREGEDADGAHQAQNIKVGVVHGRRFAGSERPGFIHPSPEPLKASIEKQEQMKQEMRQLLKLKIAQTTSVRVSKDSKEMDERTLENGLSAIGLELERGERLIGEIWASYTNSTPPTIHYPMSYNLKSDAERRAEAKELEELKGAVPSATYAKEVSKIIADTVLGNVLNADRLREIEKEVDDAPGYNSDSEKICRQVEAGICDPDTASTLLGYPAGTAAKAAKAIEDKAMAVAKAQAAASPTPPAVTPGNGGQNRAAEKDPATNKSSQGTRQRGPGK